MPIQERSNGRVLFLLESTHKLRDWGEVTYAYQFAKEVVNFDFFNRRKKRVECFDSPAPRENRVREQKAGFYFGHIDPVH